MHIIFESFCKTKCTPGHPPSPPTHRFGHQHAQPAFQLGFVAQNGHFRVFFLEVVFLLKNQHFSKLINESKIKGKKLGQK